ncbi:MAG TPA: hypothetical protein DF296_10785 [Candidatus Margulisbacteria bacterium]|nr:hypothetical protein [Candidatus Margulisiibacteriota bacterium]
MNKKLSKTMIRIMGLFCVLVVVGMMFGCSKPEGDKEYQYKFPAWTPDGKIVAVRRTIVTYPDGGGFGGGGYGGYEEYHLVKFNDDGSGEQTIKEVGSDSGYISVSTSGNYIGYAVNNYIDVIDWSGNQVNQIQTGVDGDAEYFDWSPSENKIVLERNNNSSIISVYDIPSQTFVDYQIGDNPSWKFNQNIVYQSYDGSNFLMNYIDMVNGLVVTSNINMNDKHYPQFLPNQDRVILFSRAGIHYNYDFNNNLTVTTNDQLTDFWRVGINFSGSKIIYDVEHKHIGVVNIDGTNKRQIK